MTDFTVVGTAAITAAAGLGGAGLQALVGRRQIAAESDRQRWQDAQRRRDERKIAYQVALDLLADFYWDSEVPSEGYDVVTAFTKPFVHAANAVRVYGSDAALAAVERIQQGLLSMNAATADSKTSIEELEGARAEFFGGYLELFNAAREDVGPREGDVAQDGTETSIGESTLVLARGDVAIPDAASSSRRARTALAGGVRTFPEDYRPENAPESGPVTISDTAADLSSERDRIYAHNRNLFLTHIWRPSQWPPQLADISIRLEEHSKRHGPGKDMRPLAQGLVEKVEYSLGPSWFGGKSVVKTNAEDDFRLDISAFGPALCLARVHLEDGTVLLLDRYLDFADTSGERT